MKPQIICIIPARLASTRFPGKMLFSIKGKSLLQRTYECVEKCSIFDKIFIATDDQKIFDHVKSFSNPIMTSSSCKNGTERITEALKTLSSFQENDIIINVQGDNPLITANTIEKTYEILKNDNTASMSTAAVPFLNKEDIFSPHMVKVIFDKENNALYFSRSPIPYSKNINTANYYLHIGIYAYRYNFLNQLEKLSPTNNQLTEDLEQLKVLEHGYKIKVALVDENPIGVDTPEDIMKLEKYL